MPKNGVKVQSLPFDTTGIPDRVGKVAEVTVLVGKFEEVEGDILILHPQEGHNWGENDEECAPTAG